MRDKDPAGVNFIERSFIYRWQKEAEHNKKMEQEMRKHKRGKR